MGGAAPHDGRVPVYIILDLRNNQVTNVSPIAGHRAFRMLFLQGNKVSNLGPLLANVKKDAAGRREFSPFLRVWLKGNPVPKGQVAELKKLVKEVQ